MIRSRTMRMPAGMGYSHSFWAMYSFRMSACTVPERASRGVPRRSAITRYIAKRIQAVGLIVIETLILPMSIPSRIPSRSSTVSTATPSRPTSPRALGSSESTPMRVGMSKSIEMPVWPCAIKYLSRALVSPAVPNPAIWRIVQGRDRYMVG